MANLTPIEEYNKSLREGAREVRKSAEGMRAPFKQLIGSVQEINSEFAQITAETLGQTQDTWKGLISQGKKDRLINAQKEDAKFKAESDRVKAADKQEAVLKTQRFQQENKHINDRQSAIDKDIMGFNSINGLNNRKLELEKKYQEASNQDKIKIAADIGEIAGKISTRSDELTTVIDSEHERETKSIDSRIKQERENVREGQRYIDETNETLKENLEKASESPTYDKFTGSIKTLTGGFLDIGGVLDPIAKQVGALKDLGSALGSMTGVSGGLTKFKSFLKKSNEEGAEQSEELADRTEAAADGLDEITGRSSGRGLFGMMRSMSLGTIIFIALVAAVVLLLTQLDHFSDWLKAFTGNKEDDQRKNFETRTENYKKAMTDAGNDEGLKAKLTEVYKKESNEMLAKQGDRVSQEFKEDIIDRMDNVVQSSSASAVGVSTGLRLGNARTGLANLNANLAVQPQPRGVDGRFQAKPTASVGSKVSKLAQGFVRSHPTMTNVGLKVAKFGSKGALPLSMALTWWEVKKKLAESENMGETLDEMWKSGSLEEEHYREGKKLVALKKEKDDMIPWYASGAALAAGLVVGAILTSTGVGAPVGLALIAGATAAYGVSEAVTAGMDYMDTSDDELYKFMKEKTGQEWDADKAAENLELMESQQGTTLQQGQADLTKAIEDAGSGGQGGVNLASVVNNSSSNSNNSFTSSGPKDPESTTAALNQNLLRVGL